MSIMQLFIDKKSILKRFFTLWTSAAQFPNSFICILDITFTDPVHIKNNKEIIWE